MRFIALDVETANPDMSSICQIGIVHFEDGKPVETWSSHDTGEEHWVVESLISKT